MSSLLENIELVLGGHKIPNRLRHDYTEEQHVTSGDLTRLLIERAPRAIPPIVTGLIQDKFVSPYTSFLLPIRELGPEEGIVVKWSEIHFDPSYARETEVWGTGRTFTYTKSENGARMVRRGAAVHVERGFQNTKEGREMWALQIKQLATGIQNTNELDCLLTLLETPMVTANNPAPSYYYYGMNRNSSFQERLETHMKMFGLVNKTPDSRGFASLVANMRTVMGRNGVRPDAMVVPPYMLEFYYSANNDMWHHSSAGPMAVANREGAFEVNDTSGISAHEIQGMKLIDTHVYRSVVGINNTTSDLLTIPQQIGEFYPMEIESVYRDNKSFREYRSQDRDLQIFDEETETFATAHFGDALNNTFRFEDDGSLSENHTINMTDMFVNKDLGKVVKRWGEMEAKYLPLPQIDNVVTSFVYNSGLDIANLNTLIDAFLGSDKTAEKITAIQQQLKGLIDTLSSSMPHIGDDSTVNVLRAFLLGSTDLKKSTTNATNYIFISNTYKDKFANTDRKEEIVESIGRKSAVEKLVMLWFLMQPINLKSMIRMHEHDIYVPVDIILARPYMTYNTSSVIVMKAGAETGETYIGETDFQLGSNPQDKSMTGFFTYYGKAVVRNPKNVIVAPNVFIQNYIRGNNMKYISQQVLENEINSNSGVFQSDQSLLAIMVPVTGRLMEKSWIDIRGSHKNVRNGVLHQSGDYYRNLYRIDDQFIMDPLTEYFDYENRTFRPNTICYLGHIRYGRDFQKSSCNRGHLGPITYDHVNLSRKEGVFAKVSSVGKIQ